MGGLVSIGRRAEKRPVRPFGVSAMRISASSFGRDTGSVRRRTASRSWKIAVFAPMPSASDRIATTAKPGVRRRRRTPYFRSRHSVSTKLMVFM